MADLSFYDSVGAISRVISVPDDEVDFYLDLYGEFFPAQLDPATQYIDLSGEEPTPSPLLSFNLILDKTAIKADGVDILKVSGFPQGAIVSIAGPCADSWEEAGEEFEITVNSPGDYIVSARKWPYITQQVNFSAT